MATRKLLPLMKPVPTYSGWKPEELETLSYILTAVCRSAESAFLLCAFGQLWDAEVVARSAFEGTLKFCYLLQSEATFHGRHQEYAVDLFAIGRTKDHLKAEALLAAVPNPDADEWRPIRDLLLPEQELIRIRGAYDKPHRRELESRWGFTGLVGELSRSGDPLFRGLGAMAHGYSVASHVAHVDMAGASIPMDRDLRSLERRETVHLAHEGRLISDLLCFLFWRLGIGYRFVEADTKPLKEAWSTIKGINSKFDAARERWMDVEYPFESD